MKKVQKADYKKYILQAGSVTANRVYPLSIAEGFQSGDIFVNEGTSGQSVLFWHYCGFGFISGSPSPDFLEEVYAVMTANENRRRLLLITDDDHVISFLKLKMFKCQLGWNMFAVSRRKVLRLVSTIRKRTGSRFTETDLESSKLTAKIYRRSGEKSSLPSPGRTVCIF